MFPLFFFLFSLKPFIFGKHSVSWYCELHSPVKRNELPIAGETDFINAFLNVTLNGTGPIGSPGLSNLQQINIVLCIFTFDGIDKQLLWKRRMSPASAVQPRKQKSCSSLATAPFRRRWSGLLLLRHAAPGLIGRCHWRSFASKKRSCSTAV